MPNNKYFSLSAAKADHDHTEISDLIVCAPKKKKKKRGKGILQSEPHLALQLVIIMIMYETPKMPFPP